MDFFIIRQDRVYQTTDTLIDFYNYIGLLTQKERVEVILAELIVAETIYDPSHLIKMNFNVQLLPHC